MPKILDRRIFALGMLSGVLLMLTGCVTTFFPPGVYSTTNFPEEYYVNNLPACGHWRVWGNGFLDCNGNWHPNQDYNNYHHQGGHRNDHQYNQQDGRRRNRR